MFVYTTGMFEEVKPAGTAPPALPASLTALATAVTQYCADAGCAGDGQQLSIELPALRHVIDELELAFATRAAAFAATDAYELQGSLSPAEWVRHHGAVAERAEM